MPLFPYFEIANNLIEKNYILQNYNFYFELYFEKTFQYLAYQNNILKKLSVFFLNDYMVWEFFQEYGSSLLLLLVMLCSMQLKHCL